MTANAENAIKGFLTPILLAILIGIGSWFASTVLADVGQLKQDQLSQKAAVDLRVQALEAQISALSASQERTNKLLVKIATRMGIEVAE
jgi:hypothetical protein